MWFNEVHFVFPFQLFFLDINYKSLSKVWMVKSPSVAWKGLFNELKAKLLILSVVEEECVLKNNNSFKKFRSKKYLEYSSLQKQNKTKLGCLGWAHKYV